MKTFSVIIPFFESSRISNAVNSVLAQRHRDYEIIIADDSASNGELLKIKLAPEMFTEPRIKFIQNKENIGLTRSLNHSIRKSDGRYIVRLDDDDEMLPGRLQILESYFAKGYEFVGTNSTMRLNGVDQMRTVPGRALDYKNMIEAILDSRAACAHSAFAFSRDIFERISGYNENFSYAQDRDFLLRLLETNARAIVVPEALTVINIENGSISNSKSHQDQIAFGLLAQVRNKFRDVSNRETFKYLMESLRTDFRWQAIIKIENLKRKLRITQPEKRLTLFFNPSNVILFLLFPFNRLIKNSLVRSLNQV